jgi:2'-5' RNA ligase
VTELTRAFAAIALPAAVKEHLAATLVQLDRRTTDPLGMWVPQANWHVTLAFFGSVDPSGVDRIGSGLAQVAANGGPFRIALAGAGSFRQDLTWIGLAGATGRVTDLMTAARRLAGRGGPAAHPHVTVARGANAAVTARWVTALRRYTGPPWTVSRIHLMASELSKHRGVRSRYTSLESYALTSPDPTTDVPGG